MSTHKSAEKRSRQAVKHRECNNAVKSNIKTGVKSVLEAVETKDPEAANAALAKTAPAIAKAAAKGGFSQEDRVAQDLPPDETGQHPEGLTFPQKSDIIRRYALSAVSLASLVRASLRLVSVAPTVDTG